MAFPSQHVDAKATHSRRAPRSGRHVPVRFVTDDGEELEQHGTTRNLGVGGAFIATPDPAPPGSRIALRLDLPSGRTLVVRAEVRWIADGDLEDEVGMGVRFQGLQEEELRALHASISAT